VQAVGIFMAILFGAITYNKLIPDYPAWDNVDLLCRVFCLVGMVIFFVTVHWGSSKYMDANFVPLVFKIYAASLLIQIPIYLLLCNIFSGNIMLNLIIVFIVYSTVPQFFIWRYLKKLQKNYDR
jgi:hypothetical protein